MKNLFFVLLLIQFNALFGQQYFSGVITRNINIEPKSDTVNMERLLAGQPGVVSEYTITNGYYRNTFYDKDGNYMYSYTYHGETKRMYDDYPELPYITYRDSRKSNTEYYGSEIFRDSIKNILGYECFTTVRKADYGVSTNFYSEKVKVDHETFKDHQVGNWYESIKEVDGCISIGSATEYEDHFVYWEPETIEKKELTQKDFALSDKQVFASYQALDKQIDIEQPTQSQIGCYQNKVMSVSKMGGEKVYSYVRFTLTKDGKMENITPLEEDEQGLYKIAVDIVENCGFKFIPGEIDGVKVDAEGYFPVEFRL